MGINLQEVSYTYQAGTPFEEVVPFLTLVWRLKMAVLQLLLAIRVVANQQLCNC